ISWVRDWLRGDEGWLSAETHSNDSKALNRCELFRNFNQFMRFLLQLPPPVSFFIVSAVTTFFGLFGLYLVRRKYSAEVLKENHEVAAIIFNAFGLFYGVMVACVVFVTWSGYDEATKNLQMEASEALDIVHSSDGFPAPVNKTIRDGLRDYLTSVY